MPPSVFNPVSGAAFAAFLYCFSLLFSRTAGGALRAHYAVPSGAAYAAAPTPGAASALCCAAAFYFVPAGSLPPFVSHRAGGFAVAILLLLSGFFGAPRGARGSGVCRALGFPLAFCAAWGELAYFAAACGVPGALGNLGTYAVMPLWTVAGSFGRAAMACLFVMFLSVFPEFPRFAPGRGVRDGAGPALPVLLCAALVAVLLFSWNISPLLALDGSAAFFCDFIFFWIKTAALCAVMTAAGRAAESTAYPRRAAFALFCALCGAVLMYMERMSF